MSLTTIIQVFHVPKMKNNFIFVSKIISKDLKVEFDKDACKVDALPSSLIDSNVNLK
jgi:hypothetical protein